MLKLDYSRVTPVTEIKILDFLNYARIPEDIAGSEPQEGPVYDNPLFGYGNQIRDYDIGELVAARMITLRDSFPGKVYTYIQQLDTVKGFGQDKLDDMIYSFGYDPNRACRPRYCGCRKGARA